MKRILWDVDTQVDFVHRRRQARRARARRRRCRRWRGSSRAARAAGIPHIASADDHELTDLEISDRAGLLVDVSAALPARDARRGEGATQTAQADPVPLALTEVPDRWLRGREFLLLKKSFDVFTNPNADRLLELLAPDEVVLFGVATDVCDDAAIRGLLARGLSVVFVEAASRGLDEARTDCLPGRLARRRGASSHPSMMRSPRLRQLPATADN